LQYMNNKEAAKLWNCSEQWIALLCRKGKIEGAIKNGRSWLIPMTVATPLKNNKATNTHEVRKLSALPLPVGISDYMRAESSYYYVDKTLLIKELLDEGSSVSLFMRPRRFGKTLALNMLKVFFEKTELDTSVFFKYRKLWQCGTDYQGFQGKYPVIYLSFKDIKCATWEEALEKIALLLQDEYARHMQCLEESSLDIYKEYYNKVLCCRASKTELSEALGRLSLFLAKAYSSKVVILIDEYDTPIQQGYIKGYYQEILDFMRSLLSGGLKDNNNLFKGVLTGILRVSKENLFSGLNNLTIDTVADSKYAQYFGFTEQEIVDMAAYYDRNGQLEEIKHWYDGYHFGSLEIYNPWSVINYFNNLCVPKAFWANTSENIILKELLSCMDVERAEAIRSLLEGKTVVARLNFNIIYPKLQDNLDTIYSFLLLAGYLKCDAYLGGGYYELSLPNNEVKQIYREEFIAWLGNNFQGNIVNSLRKALVLQDKELLELKLREFLQASVSCFDYSSEGFYHGLMLGLVAAMADKYYVKSNREVGLGRFDLQLEPRNKSLPGFILEFKSKAKTDQEELTQLAEEALQQIAEKKYAYELKERNIMQIYYYGIAFSGKQVKIAVGKIE